MTKMLLAVMLICGSFAGAITGAIIGRNYGKIRSKWKCAENADALRRQIMALESQGRYCPKDIVETMRSQLKALERK
jgi:hypothetical protein